MVNIFEMNKIDTLSLETYLKSPKPPLDPSYRFNTGWQKKILFVLERFGSGSASEIATRIHYHESSRNFSEILTYVEWYLPKMQVRKEGVNGATVYSIE